MAYFLGVLKVIGIILLVILGLIIFSILNVLFYPLSYKLNAKYDECFDVNAKFSWFFRCVRGNVNIHNKEISIYLYVLFWQIYPFKSRTNKKVEKRRKTNIDSNGSSKPKESKTIKTVKNINPDATDTLTNIEPDISIEAKDDIPNNIIEENNIDNDCEYNEESLGYFEKIRIIIKKVFDFFINIKYSLLKICDKIERDIENINYYIDLFQDDNTKKVFKKVKVLLYDTYMSIKPKKFSMNLHFGFKNDPELEGKLLMIHGLLYPFHNGKIIMVPDFETDTRTADLFIKGRVRAFVFLKFLNLYLFDKNFKILKRSFSRSKEEF